MGSIVGPLDRDGRRRLDDPDDFVRSEIEAALTRKVRVIPILVDGARMPRADDLPVSLSALVRRQALELSPSRLEYTFVGVRNPADDNMDTEDRLPGPTWSGDAWRWQVRYRRRRYAVVMTNEVSDRNPGTASVTTRSQWPVRRLTRAHPAHPSLPSAT